MDHDDLGVLDEALIRLHATGPEFEGWLSNHGPMAVEALVRRGQGARVHRWLDGYRRVLEERPGSYGPITAENWREALGDARYLADWAGFFGRLLAERPWRAVLAEWWPRLLPGIAGGATHPVIRVGHAVRVLLAEGESAPRIAELAQGLGYWAARHQPLPAGAVGTAAASGADAALGAVAGVPDPSRGINHRLEQVRGVPDWPGAGERDPAVARQRLTELVRAAAGFYAEHAHGNPVMLVHAVTAPNAVLRTLPALPGELWWPGLRAAWAASAAVVAAYRPAGPQPEVAVPDGLVGAELFERAAVHGDEHAIKLVDTLLDVVDGPDGGTALGAGLRALELIEPG
ncbi:questin oxidase family protein [Streptomyces sp. NPDC059853]|uniref:questin oxidase family protein n=1 Tax=Streptomyces sp. NPDC059853 TaxID=3346973 RepID=UPI003647BF66